MAISLISSDYLNKEEIMKGLGMVDMDGNLLLKVEKEGEIIEASVKPQREGFHWIQKRADEIERTYQEGSTGISTNLIPGSCIFIMLHVVRKKETRSYCLIVECFIHLDQPSKQIRP